MALTMRSTWLQSPANQDRLDFTVYEAGKPVGRIYETASIETSPDFQWLWSITAYVDPELDIVTSGKVPTFEEAKMQFRRNWEKARGREQP
jgi:hypothetical protein